MARKTKTTIEEIEQQQDESPAKELHTFYSWDGETLIINVLGTPSAKRDAIGAVQGNQLKISVREAPQGGKATDYMVRFLAAEFNVSVKDIQVVSGRFNVNKQIRITNPRNLPNAIVREAAPVKVENTFQKHKKNHKTR